MCGLKRRLHYPEFQSLISNYDVFCVQETKLDNTDVISLNNYTFLSQIRKQKFMRRSGGIGVSIKNELLPFVRIKESESDYIFWLQFSNQNKISLKMIF